MLVAGDVGGTKTLLGLYEPESGARKPLVEREFRSGEFRGLAEIVRSFLVPLKKRVTRACFDVAGPVIDQRASLTNLPWSVDAKSLSEELHLTEVTLLNDLEAIAIAVPELRPDEVHVVNAGVPERGAPIAVIAPGTGLGEAFAIHDGARYIACPSEGGHADFAPRNDLQAGLWKHLMARYGHVACERACSGKGIPDIYEYLRGRAEIPSVPEFEARLATAQDRTPLIVDAALGERTTNPLAAATLDLFVAILGGEAGNLALKVLARGGVYLAGGIPPRILPLLQGGSFMAAFAAKGRLSSLLVRIPVKVVVTRAALLGAALHGLSRLGPRSPRTAGQRES